MLSTTTPPESPSLARKRSLREQYPAHHPLRDHVDDTMSSLDETSSSGGTGDFTTLPASSSKSSAYQRHHRADYRHALETSLSPVRPFSMEQTFDKAMEKGLDLILNTNAWACTSGGGTGRHRYSTPQPTRNGARGIAQTRTNPRVGRNPVEMKYSPQRRRTVAASSSTADLMPSLSAETPRSDFTGVTEIATNRAVDLAMKRIREIENGNGGYALDGGGDQTELVARRMSPKLDEAAVRQAEVIASRIAARSILSVSSNESSGAAAAVGRGVVRSGAVHQDNEMAVPKPSTVNPSGRLGKHVEHIDQVAGSDDASKSVSLSSVGAEISHGQHPNVYQMAKSSLRAATTTRFSKGRVAPGRTSDRIKEEIIDEYDDGDASNGILLPALLETTVAESSRIETRTFRVSTPVEAAYPSRQTKPLKPPFDGVGACLSPPQIIRKTHSYEETMSPDPIFCSKSMSMSVHSHMISPTRTANSPVSSVEASFQSDNAMFMEKVEESCSSVMSNSVGAVDAEHHAVNAPLVRPYDSLKLRWETKANASAEIPSQPVTSRWEKKRHVVETVVRQLNARDQEELPHTAHEMGSDKPHSQLAVLSETQEHDNVDPPTYLRPGDIGLRDLDRGKESQDDAFTPKTAGILGIRGSFPRKQDLPQDTAPQQRGQAAEAAEPEPTAALSKSFDESVMSRTSTQRLVPLVSLVLPSIRTRSLLASTVAAGGSDPMNNGNVPTRRPGVANPFLAAISSKSSSTKGDHVASHGTEPNSIPPTELTRKSGLNEKMSRARKATRCSDIDVDVKSIRSAFESVISPMEEDVENDDDTASVKSLRERFEPIPPVQTENGIAKARALFEGKKAATTKPFEIANSSLKQTFSKFETPETVHSRGPKLSRGLRASRFSQRVEPHVNEPTLRIGEDADESSLSVADRVKAFSGDNESKRANIRSAMSAKARSSPSLPGAESRLSTKPTTLVGSAHRAARQKVQTWRALRDKTSKFGLCVESEHTPHAEPDEKDQKNMLDSKSVKSSEQETLNSPLTKLNDDKIENTPPSQMAKDSSSDLPHVGLTAPSATAKSYIRKRVLKPTWLAQREKILSRARISEVDAKRDAASGNDGHSGRPSVSTADQQNTTRSHVHHANRREADAEVATESREPAEITKAPAVELEDTPRSMSDVRKVVVSASQQTQSSLSSHERKRSQRDEEVVNQKTTEILNHDKAEQTAEEKGNGHPVSKEASPSETVADQVLTPHPRKEVTTGVDTIENGIVHGDVLGGRASRNAADCETSDTLSATPNSVGPAEEEKKESTPEDFDEALDQKLGFASSRDIRMPSFRSSNKFVADPNQDISEPKSKERPVVIKPVARKPYVRPVAIKPVVKPVPVMPFARSTNLMNHRGPTAKCNPNGEYDVGIQTFPPGPLNTVMDDSLALPSLVAGIIKPFSAADIIDSTSEDSEFSDGVTLDLSIAEVSNLTNPTALISRTGGVSFDAEQTRSAASEDGEQTSDERSKSKSSDLLDVEAKRSEASSSQTSEAAAPLIAKALRTFPLSDDFSGESFFRARVVLAKQLWNDNSDHSRGKASSIKSGGEEKSADDPFGDERNDSWNIRQVESLFPTSWMPVEVTRSDPFEDWNPFPVDFDRAMSPFVNDNPTANEGKSADVTPSRSKTPTRGNKSKGLPPSDSVRLPYLNSTETLKQFHSAGFRQPDADQGRPVTRLYDIRPLVSAVTSSDPSSVGHLLSSGSSDYATSSAGGSRTYGPKHVALLARIHALKEARLRRAAAIYNRAVPIRLAGPIHGSGYFSGLEVD
jgi:hypothetical protein